MKRTIILALGIMLGIAASAQNKALKESVVWDRINANPAPLPLAGHIEHKESELSRQSYWSVGSETLDRNYADFDSYVDYMKATGVGYARLQSGWAKSEPRVGQYNFGWLDHQVDGLLARGIHPWLCLCYGNPAYTSLGYDLNAGIFTDGKVMEGWLNYVREVVKRYKGKVTMYEVWNEPDGAKAANGIPGESWREYAKLFVETARVIRKTDPDAKIAAFGAFSIDKEYFRNGLAEIKRLGGIENVDYVTYHAYWPFPERIVPHIQKLKKDCEESNPAIRVLQGESGCPAHLEFGHAMCNIEWSELSQAKWDLRHMCINFSMGIPSSVFTMVDLNYGWMVQSFGLLRTDLKGKPRYYRPKYHAVQNVTSLLTADLVSDESIKFKEADVNYPFFTVGLKKGGEKIGCLLWVAAGKPNESMERRMVNIQFDGITFKDPVYIDMMSGAVYEVSQLLRQKNSCQSFANLPVWDSPIAIVERSYVNFR